MVFGGGLLVIEIFCGMWLESMMTLVRSTDCLFLNIHLLKKIVGEPDASVKPYEVVAQELNYMPQYQIVMPEKTAVLYFCDKEGFYCKFAHYLNASIKE